MDVPRSVHGPRRDAVASGESARATLIQDRRMRRSPSNTMAGVNTSQKGNQPRCGSCQWRIGTMLKISRPATSQCSISATTGRTVCEACSWDEGLRWLGMMMTPEGVGVIVPSVRLTA